MAEPVQKPRGRPVEREEPMRLLNLRLPVSLCDRLKAVSHRTGKPMTYIVEMVLDRELLMYENVCRTNDFLKGAQAQK